MIALALSLGGCSSKPPVVKTRGARSTPETVATPGVPGGVSLANALSQRGGCEPAAPVIPLEIDATPRRTFRNTASPAFPKVGDVVLVDVSSFDDAQHLIESVNTFGVLESHRDDRWTVRDARTRKIVGVQLHETDRTRAPKGEYRLRSTGAVVGRPMYYVQIERHTSSPASGCIIAGEGAR